MLLTLFILSHDLLHPFPLPVPSPAVDTEQVDEVDIGQRHMYTVEDASDSELEAGKKLACKVSPVT